MAFRPLALWLLGYPGTASVEIGRAIDAARDTGHAPTLMFVLGCTTFTHICRRDHAAAKLQIDEALALTEEKGAVFFNAMATAQRGCELALTGKSAAAVATISAGVTGYRSTGATVWTTLPLSLLATAYADLGKFDDAWRHLGETMKAVETANERWYEADINRISGEIALNSPEPDATKAQVYFERALSLARAQHAKSLELRAATSMARLLRDQGKRDKAHELLAPVYGWFTEGFDTPDLKEAKALLAS